jgi:hypothetical protein
MAEALRGRLPAPIIARRRAAGQRRSGTQETLMATIIFNGQVYDSLDDMPAEARQAYERAMSILADRNQNGVPDVLEGVMPLGSGQVQIVSANKIIVNGKTYSSPDEMPPDARQAYETFADAFDKNRNGILDIFEDALPPDMVPQDQPGLASLEPAPIPAAARPSTPNLATGPTPDANANRLRLVGAVIGVLLVLAAFVLLLVFVGPLLFPPR